MQPTAPLTIRPRRLRASWTTVALLATGPVVAQTSAAPPATPAASTELVAITVALGVASLLYLAWATRHWWRPHRRRHTQVPLELRVLRAERRAAEAEAVVRAGLLPHLARLLRTKLVVALLGQRKHLLETQHHATGKVTELEQRLASAHSGIQEKLSSYQQRIQELEGRPPATDTPTAPVAPAPPPRRNPFAKRPPTPPIAPVQFTDIVSRHQSDRPE